VLPSIWVSSRSLGALSFRGLICPATNMRLAPNAKGFSLEPPPGAQNVIYKEMELDS
jgi:hypothetical protein